MVRQHANSLSLTALLASIIPSQNGFKTFVSLQDKMNVHEYGYSSTPLGPTWRERVVRFNPGSMVPTSETLETPIGEWKMNMFFSDLDSKPMHIVGS